MVSNLKNKDLFSIAMLHRLIRSATLAALAVFPLFTGCDGDDPKVRQEIAELRTRLTELERDNSRLETALEEARSKAVQTDFLARDVLRRNLDGIMPELRATLTRAFPGRTVDPVSTGTISTPLDADGFPYNAELSFGLSEGPGQRVITYTLNLKADRQGDWRLPDLTAFAADAAPRRGGSAANRPAAPPAGGSGPRIIDWGQENAGARGAPPPTAPPNAAPAPPAAAPSAPSAPAAPAPGAPFPVQDTRTIQFD